MSAPPSRRNFATRAGGMPKPRSMTLSPPRPVSDFVKFDPPPGEIASFQQPALSMLAYCFLYRKQLRTTATWPCYPPISHHPLPAVDAVNLAGNAPGFFVSKECSEGSDFVHLHQTADG